MKTKKIILLTDIIEKKVRKEKELKYYKLQLTELMVKRFWLNKDIQMTEKIISVIEREKNDEIEKRLIKAKYESD